MSLIKNLLTSEKILTLEFPGIDGFTVDLCYIDRDTLRKIQRDSTVIKYNQTTRQRGEETDSDKFLEIYTAKAIKGWSGLKVKDLPKLAPVDISTYNKDDDVVYSEEDALDLIKNSIIFDQFVTDAMADHEQFSITKQEETVKN